jgi:hypothetical protein
MKRVVPRFGLMASLFGASTAPTADLCFTTTPITPPFGGFNASVDCDPVPELYDNEWIGFSTDGVSCRSDGPNCVPTSDTPARYTWSISASSTDPYVNTGALGDAATLYLWFLCGYQEGNGRQEGLSFAEFAVTGTISVTSFTPRSGVWNHGTDTELLMAVANCPRSLFLAGEFQEAILFLPSVTGGTDRFTERQLRPLPRMGDWDEQARCWQALVGGATPAPASSAAPRPGCLPRLH